MTKVIHNCHAHNCKTEVPPKMFMCLKHWRMIPKELQALVWKHYRTGQEIDKNPTSQYLEVTDQIEWFVRGREYERKNG